MTELKERLVRIGCYLDGSELPLAKHEPNPFKPCPCGRNVWPQYISDTPRTDAWLDERGGDLSRMDEWARQLERELNKSKAQLDEDLRTVNRCGIVMAKLMNALRCPDSAVVDEVHRLVEFKNRCRSALDHLNAVVRALNLDLRTPPSPETQVPTTHA